MRFGSDAATLASAAGWNSPAVSSPTDGSMPIRAAAAAWRADEIERARAAGESGNTADQWSDADELIEVLAAAGRQAALADDIDALSSGALWEGM
jgi:hypothetical protein